MAEEKIAQVRLLYNLLQDQQPHSTKEIMAKVYGNDHLGLARVGARIHDIKKHPEKYGEVSIAGWKDKENRSVYWYQLKFKTLIQTFEPTIYSTDFIKRQEAKKQLNLSF